MGWQSIRIVGASACVIFILHQKIQKMAKCTFWYQFTRVVLDKVQRAVKNGHVLYTTTTTITTTTITTTTNTTSLRLSGFCLGQPGWAGTRKVKPWRWNQSGFTGARDSEWQWHQLHHMQICTLPQTDNHASIPSLSFYRPDALSAAQPTVSKHWGPS